MATLASKIPLGEKMAKLCLQVRVFPSFFESRVRPSTITIFRVLPAQRRKVSRRQLNHTCPKADNDARRERTQHGSRRKRARPPYFNDGVGLGPREEYSSGKQKRLTNQSGIAAAK